MYVPALSDDSIALCILYIYENFRINKNSLLALFKKHKFPLKICTDPVGLFKYTKYIAKSLKINKNYN